MGIVYTYSAVISCTEVPIQEVKLIIIHLGALDPTTFQKNELAPLFKIKICRFGENVNEKKKSSRNYNCYIKDE